MLSIMKHVKFYMKNKKVDHYLSLNMILVTNREKVPRGKAWNVEPGVTGVK